MVFKFDCGEDRKKLGVEEEVFPKVETPMTFHNALFVCINLARVCLLTCTSKMIYDYSVKD